MKWTGRVCEEERDDGADAVGQQFLVLVNMHCLCYAFQIEYEHLLRLYGVHPKFPTRQLALLLDSAMLSHSVHLQFKYNRKVKQFE